MALAVGGLVCVDGFMRWRVVRVVAVAMLGVTALASGCGTSRPDQTAEPPVVEGWGHEAVEFLDAQAAAICSQDIYDVARFYAVDAIADYRTITLGRYPGQLRRGRQAITTFLDRCLFSPTSDLAIDVVDYFLHPAGAVTVERWTGQDGQSTLAVVTTVGAAGIELIRYFTPIDLLAPSDDDPVGGDPLVAIEPLLAENWPDVGRAELEVFGFRTDGGPIAEVVVTAPGGAGPCPTRTATWLVIDDGGIVGQRRHLDVESGRSCSEVGEAGAGWWTGFAVPPPLDQQQTGTLLIGDNPVAIFNGTAERAALIEWSLGRFPAAGVGSPPLDAVIFEPTRACQDLTALAEFSSFGTTIYLCMVEVACATPSCDGFSEFAKAVTLHELAHSWIESSLDPDRGERFVELVGATSWDDPIDRWEARGIEWAAEVVAWGLMDERMQLRRLDYPPCELIADGFRLLTGREPLVAC